MQGLAYGFLGGLVEPGERLVEHQDPGVCRKQAGEHDPALLASAELVDRAVTEAVGIQPDAAQGGVCGLLVGAGGVADVLADGGAQQRQAGVLDAQQGAVAPVVEGAAVEGDGAGTGCEQPGEHPRESGLAGAVGSGDQHGVACGDVEIHPGKDRVLPGCARVVDEIGPADLDTGSADVPDTPPLSRGRGR